MPERAHAEQPPHSCSVRNKDKKCCAVPAGRLGGWVIPHSNVPRSHSTKPKPDSKPPSKPPRQGGKGEDVHFLLLSMTELSEVKMRFGTAQHHFVPCQSPAQVPGDRAVLGVCRSVSPRVRWLCWSQQPARPLHRRGVPADEDAFEQRWERLKSFDTCKWTVYYQNVKQLCERDYPEGCFP